MACFYHWYLHPNLCYKELHTLLKIRIIYMWQQKMNPTRQVFIGSPPTSTATHHIFDSCSEPTTVWHLQKGKTFHEAASSVISISPKIVFCCIFSCEWGSIFAFGVTFQGNPDIEQCFIHQSSWCQRQIFSLLKRGYPVEQLSRTRSIDDAMQLFQINDLVMFGYAFLSHSIFRIHKVCHCFVLPGRKKAW